VGGNSKGPAFMIDSSPTGGRVSLLDALRGMAVLGILVDNIQEFAMPHADFFHPISYGDATGWNYVAWHVSNLLFSGRFFSILMMVFGAGMLLAETRPDRAAPRHLRRMGVLAILGLVHGWLLWDGDILFAMALAGLCVFPLRRCSTRLLVALALTVGLGAPAVMVASGIATARHPLAAAANFDPDWEPAAADTQSQITHMLGSWSDQQTLRSARSAEFYMFVIPVYLLWRVSSLALLGMALLRCGLLTGGLARARYRMMVAASVLIGLPLSVSAVQAVIVPDLRPEWQFPLALAYEYVVVTIAALGWISALVLVSGTARGHSLVTPLAAVGRLSLTNYITQTLVCTGIFYGFGLGLFGQVPRWGQLAITFAIWSVQVMASNWWLRHFRYGPLEWLWRAAAYGNVRWSATPSAR
jgi:uncharacterized protein